MTVFGVIGFILFSSTIYLSLIGGIIGIGVGRFIGSKFKSRMRYQSLDQKIIYEMELLLKWARRKRKKQELDNKNLMLLIETITMESAYLLEKLEMKKVAKFFNKYGKFLTEDEVVQTFVTRMPSARDFPKNTQDDFRKREMYRLFNFYIPLTRILEVGTYKGESFKESNIFRRLFAYVTGEETIEAIIEMCEANETLSSQFAIPFEKSDLKQIIIDCLEMLEKTEPFKRLENRVLEEIISNVNLDDIKINESQFDRNKRLSSHSDNEQKSLIQPEKPSDCDLRKKRTTLVNASFIPKGEEGSVNANASFHSDQKAEEEKANISAAQGAIAERTVDPDFMELKETVDQDISEWSRI